MGDDTVIRDPRAVKIKRALISVSDKTGIIEFAEKLQGHGVEILSTGGTAKAMEQAGIKVKDVSDHTGFAEIMDGRVKTLHPTIHGGILAKRDNEDHVKAMEDNGISDIDMVVVNLYPFVETVRDGGNFDDCIENIDIGGPAMIRAAATAYALTATYDSNIASWFVGQMGEDFGFPRRIGFSGTRKQTLRYGENPHQKAALYLVDDNRRPGAASATQIQGKELSYNNLNDTDAAFELVSEFDEPAVAIIKHANPCGVAMAETPMGAYKRALACDPVSAFGGIIALNRTLTKDLAEEIIKRFVEVIIAPDIAGDALDALKAKSNIRVLTTGGMPDRDQQRRVVTRIAGGMLVQDADIFRIDESHLKIVTDREPTKKELQDLLFSFRVAKHVKSNAIVYAKNLATVGIGAGQMSRIDSSRIAAWKAEEAAKQQELEQSLAKGSVVASDAFFPFADGLIAAADAGVTAVIQPGGSIRDEEVIEAANERGLAMVFTGHRHFRH